MEAAPCAQLVLTPTWTCAGGPGTVLSEPPGIGATAPPAPHTCVTRSTRGLLSQSTYPGAAIHAGFFLSSWPQLPEFWLGSFCRCQIYLHQCQKVWSGTKEVSSPGSRDQIISSGSSAGTKPQCWWEQALGNSCVLLNGQACLSELIINQG